jgi:hypothetical protein
MRELKFRIWNGTRFVTNADTYIKTSDGSLWDYEEDYGGTFSSHKILWSAAGKIQQYTGLKDKNGVKIYEGDILERIGNGSFCKLLVYWDEPNCGFFTKRSFNLHGEGTPISDHNINISDWTYWVVVGNIFENPELIEA